MKDLNDVLRHKEIDLIRVRKEIEALKMVISLLEERPIGQAKEDSVAETQSTGTEPPLDHLESSFWKRIK